MTVSPPLPALLAAAIPIALPLAQRFRGLDVREAMVFEGPQGWAEFAPFDDYSEAAAARWLVGAIDTATTPWPAPLRAAVPVNAIVPALDAAGAQALASEAIARGCTTIKVKVGAASLDDDIARVAAVRAALDDSGVAGAIRVDANAAWSRAQAIAALRALAPFGLEYVEQPCADIDDIAAVRAAVDVPVAVDETVRGAVDPAALDLAALADVVILKPQPLGGVHATLALAETLTARGVQAIVISGSLDSAVGLSAVVATAAALPGAVRASGVGTGALLADDLLAAPLVPTDGVLNVGRVAPDPSALERAAARVSADRRAYWRARLESAWRLAATDPAVRDRVGT